MKELKSIDLSKPKNLILFIVIALVAIMLINAMTGVTYSTEGSFDIITGAFVEVFILTIFFEFFNARQQRNVEKHLEAHLRQIEDLIKSNNAR